MDFSTNQLLKSKSRPSSRSSGHLGLCFITLFDATLYYIQPKKAIGVIIISKNIKTRETVRDIKTRAPAHVGVQMKRAALKTKDAAAKQIEQPKDSPSGYAEGVVEEKVKSAVQGTVQIANAQGQKAAKQVYAKTKQKAVNKPLAPTAETSNDKSAGSPSRKSPVNRDKPADGVGPSQTRTQKSKAQQKKKTQQRGKGRADKLLSSDGKSGKPNQPKGKVKSKLKKKPGRTIGRSKKSAKTAQRSVRTTKQTVKTAAKSAKRARQTAMRMQQMIRRSIKAVIAAVKASVATVKAAIVGTKALVSAIAAGGWVAVVIIIIICLVGLLLASPFGLFFSGGSGDDGSGALFLPQVVQQLSQEHYDRFNFVQQAYEHDTLVFEGSMAINWPQVLAVYAVMVTNDPLNPMDVVTIDDERIERLRQIANEMNSFTYSLQELEDGTTLTIHMTQKSAADMVQTHGFSAEQRTMLDELLSDEFVSLWAELLGGFRHSGGEILQGDQSWQGTGMFAWPMQAGFRITSGFGMRDDPLNPGTRRHHSGIDIGAPMNTPILAMADGVVVAANATDSWGMGLGFHVIIAHGSGYETLYAHASAIGVRVDEEVEQGQVIGWVGSTGGSTGPHLHFEVRRNGRAVDPLLYFRRTQ